MKTRSLGKVNYQECVNYYKDNAPFLQYYWSSLKVEGGMSMDPINYLVCILIEKGLDKEEILSMTNEEIVTYVYLFNN